MILRNYLILIVKAKIERVYSSRFLAFIHSDDIDFTQSVSRLQTHEVIERLSNEDLHVVIVTQILNPLSDGLMW